MVRFPHLRHLADRPFATAIAGLVLVSSIQTVLKLGLTADSLASLVPDWLLTALAAVYGAGAVCLLIGMARSRVDVEAAGCILLGSGLAIRLVALWVTYGITMQVLVTTTFYVLFGWSCMERIRQITQGHRIVRISNGVKVTDDVE